MSDNLRALFAAKTPQCVHGGCVIYDHTNDSGRKCFMGDGETLLSAQAGRLLLVPLVSYREQLTADDGAIISERVNEEAIQDRLLALLQAAANEWPEKPVLPATSIVSELRQRFSNMGMKLSALAVSSDITTAVKGVAGDLPVYSLGSLGRTVFGVTDPENLGTIWELEGDAALLLHNMKGVVPMELEVQL